MAVAHTLLLADDSVTIRRVIELTFADEQVRVVSVSSGREAIASIEASPPDIVLADAGMPDVSGYDIAAFVKGRANLKHIPVILLAGAFEPLDEARARQSGSDGVLVKPFEPQMAVARVRELLSPAAAEPRRVEPVTWAVADSAAETSIPDPSLDRLDAAFAGASESEEAPTLPQQEFGDWDLAMRPAAESPLPPPITLAPKPQGGPQPAPLAEAFTSLLAAEEGRPHNPVPPLVAAPAQAAGTLSSHDMDLIVDRLIARLGADVRGVVLDVAERLVKAEIDRLKALR